MRLAPHVFCVSLLTLTVGFSGSAIARDDIMPPPKAAPLMPVERELVYDSHEKPSFVKVAVAEKTRAAKRATVEDEAVPLPEKKSIEKPEAIKPDASEVEGSAQAIDGERLNVGGKEIRLFGIVTPGLSSNYGPQARQNLDKMLKGAVLCKITDQDAEGKPVAFCGTVDVPDISYEMLRQGWATADRKALKGNQLAEIYGKAENEAQVANRGIFAPVPMATVIPLSNPEKAVTVPAPTALPEKQPVTVTEAAQQVVEAPKPAAQNPDIAAVFIEKYQTLIAAALLFFAAAVYASVAAIRERVKIREMRRSVAAALRGELLAARHIFRTRARDLINLKKPEGSTAVAKPTQYWPRIRSTVYQANVGSIGLLGSELARRVASVYGQCNDYAAYFQQAPAVRLPAPIAISQTLSILADHMDVVLEGLSQVEETARPFVLEIVSEDPAAGQVIEQEETETSEVAESDEKPKAKNKLSGILSALKKTSKEIESEDASDETVEATEAKEKKEVEAA